MSTRAEKITPAGKVKVENVISGFEPERLKAPFLLRCGALLIDYILVITVPVGSLLLGRSMGNDGAKLLNSEISNAGWLIMILIALTNFFLFPMFSGQSLGKMLTGLRIAKSDGSPPGFGSILFRHLFGYPVTLLTGGLGYLLAAFGKSGKALHDYLAGTIVVYGRKKVNKSKLPAKRIVKKKPKK